MTMRAHLETDAPLYEQIYNVYRYLYEREFAFHNWFPEATTTTTIDSHSFIASPGVAFPLCAFKGSCSFSAIIALHRIYYIRAAYIRLSRAFVYPDFYFYHYGTSVERVAIIVYSVNASSNDTRCNRNERFYYHVHSRS